MLRYSKNLVNNDGKLKIACPFFMYPVNPEDEDNFTAQYSQKSLLDEKGYQYIQNLIQEHNTKPNGLLTYNEFDNLLRRLIKTPILSDENTNPNLSKEADISLSKTSTRLFFQGIDVENTGHVTNVDLSQCYRAIHDSDYEYLSKICFRACDNDRDSLVLVSDLCKAAQAIKEDLKENIFIERCKLLLGETIISLSFAQFYQVISSGDTIAFDADPYDGKVPVTKKSSCCYLY